MHRFLKGIVTLAVAACPFIAGAAEPKETPKAKVVVGEQAPEFKVKGADGNLIDLAELTAKGPVLVRLTCGCAGCDKELAYFQEVSKSYKDQGLVSLYIFKEPDDKVAKYVKEKKLDLLWSVDPKGTAWETWQTKTMPTNFLIEKGGKIVAIAAGCDASGLMAQKVADKVAKTVDAKPVDVKSKVNEK
jgi:peroxiredoxin